MVQFESIGNLAEQVLQEVRGAKLTKLAERNIIKDAAENPPAQTALGKELVKVAASLRASAAESDDVTVAEVQEFVNAS
jgi:hypothetical protein